MVARVLSSIKVWKSSMEDLPLWEVQHMLQQWCEDKWALYNSFLSPRGFDFDYGEEDTKPRDSSCLEALNNIEKRRTEVCCDRRVPELAQSKRKRIHASRKKEGKGKDFGGPRRICTSKEPEPKDGEPSSSTPSPPKDGIAEWIHMVTIAEQKSFHLEKLNDELMEENRMLRNQIFELEELRRENERIFKENERMGGSSQQKGKRRLDFAGSSSSVSIREEKLEELVKNLQVQYDELKGKHETLQTQQDRLANELHFYQNNFGQCHEKYLQVNAQNQHITRIMEEIVYEAFMYADELEGLIKSYVPLGPTGQKMLFFLKELHEKLSCLGQLM